MTSREALEYVKMCCSDGLQLPQNQSLEQIKLIGASINNIEQDLERLEKLEKENKVLKESLKIILVIAKSTKECFLNYDGPVMEEEIREGKLL